MRSETPQRDLLSDISLVSKAQIRVVGFILGLSAALIGVTSVPFLPFLPGPSVMLLVLGIIVTLLTPAGATLGRHKFTIIDVAFVAFILVRIFVEIYNSVDLDHAIYSGIIYGQFQIYLMTWPPRLLIRNRDDLGVFLRAFAWPAAFVAILALLQLLKFPGVTEWILANVKADGLENRIAEGREDLRATSTIGHWTYLGGYLACATAMVCVDLLLSKGKPKARFTAAVSMGLLGILLVGQITTLTFATIAVAAGVVVATILRLGVRPIFAVLVVAGGLGAWSIFGEELQYRIDYQATTGRYDDPSLSWIPSTVAYRMRIWETETIPAFQERPFTGWGVQLYNTDTPWPKRPPSLDWLSPESQWMSILVTGGIITLVFFIFLMIAALVTLLRARKVLGNVVTPITALFVGLLIISSISGHFTAPGVPLPFWALFGALIPFAQRAQHNRFTSDYAGGEVQEIKSSTAVTAITSRGGP
jgi:hypothetical protein